jgi:Na+-transporting NADH:ubiquinone oxidoreductase subunit B
VIQFQKQPIMRKVVYALAPLWLFSIFLYGWKALTITAVVFVAGILSEWVMEKAKKGKTTKVSEAALVTCALFALSMPPELGNWQNLWIPIVGIIFALVMGKGVFGGFGRNIFNPAITGRLFVYLAFPGPLGTGWTTPGLFGMVPEGIDAVSAATSMDVLKGAATSADMGGNALLNLFGWDAPDWLTYMLGFETGSLGETSFILIVIAGIYLIATNTANWRLIVSTAGTAFIMMAGLHYLPPALGFEPIAKAMNPFLGIMSGSIAFVAVYMSTDPVSGAKKPRAMWAYGAIIGTVTVLIRVFAGFPEGTSFAILVANTFASLLDEVLGAKKKKAPVKAPAKPAAQEAN